MAVTLIYQVENANKANYVFFVSHDSQGHSTSYCSGHRVEDMTTPAVQRGQIRFSPSAIIVTQLITRLENL